MELNKERGKELQKAKILVCAWLTRRSFFCEEIRQKLKKAGISEEVSSETIAFYQKAGLLDDAKLRDLVIEKELRRGRGFALAAAKCRSRAKMQVEFSQNPAIGLREREEIRKILEKKGIEYGSLDFASQRKLIQFLLRRGFASENIQAVLQESEVEI